MLVRSAQLTLGRLIFLTVGFIGCGAVVAALGQWLQSFSSLSFLARGIQTKQYDDAPLYDQFINDSSARMLPKKLLREEDRKR